MGLPLRWTTNDVNNKAFDELNNISSHLFLAEIEMDCSGKILHCTCKLGQHFHHKTLLIVLGQDGWFVFTARQVDVKQDGKVEWENPIDQLTPCDGDVAARGKPAEFGDRKHYAR